MSGISFSSLPVFERYDTECKKPEKKNTYFPAFTCANFEFVIQAFQNAAFGVNNTAVAVCFPNFQLNY